MIVRLENINEGQKGLYKSIDCQLRPLRSRKFHTPDIVVEDESLALEFNFNQTCGGERHTVTVAGHHLRIVDLGIDAARSRSGRVGIQLLHR